LRAPVYNKLYILRALVYNKLYLAELPTTSTNACTISTIGAYFLSTFKGQKIRINLESGL